VKYPLFSVVTALLVSAGIFAAGCVEKGDGKGTRKSRPSFKNSGSVFDDGKDNIDPKPPEGKPDNAQPMDPEATAILASCFKIDVTEVAYIVGWDEPNEARAAAKALCAKLDQVAYGSGVSSTAGEVAVDF
jgi:hypothetical protein